MQRPGGQNRDPIIWQSRQWYEKIITILIKKKEKNSNSTQYHDHHGPNCTEKYITKGKQ